MRVFVDGFISETAAGNKKCHHSGAEELHGLAGRSAN